MNTAMLAGLVAAVSGVLYLVLPRLVRELMTRRLLVRTRRTGGVCLTFDDGPDPRSTPAILRELAAAGARGTFFVLGQQAQRHPDLVRQIIAAGHEVGEHGQAHRHAWKTEPLCYVRDLLQGRRSVADIVGPGAARLYRPAFGELNLLTLLYLLFGRRQLVMWDVNPRDFERETGAEVAARVLRALKPGRIVLLHDGRADAPGSSEVTVQAVRLILGEAVRRGLHVTSVSEAAQFPWYKSPIYNIAES